MPVNTQILRDGEARKLEHGWGWWHVDMLRDAIYKESDRVYAETGEPMKDMPTFYMGFPNEGRYEFKYDHSYVDETDGEWFTIDAGDVYTAGR